MSQHIAIITVVYKNYTVLHDLIVDLSLQHEKNFHLFVADASPDKEVVSTESIPMTVLPIENKGYAHGVNVGIKKALEMDITRFCIMNDDVSIKEDFTQYLEASFDAHPGTAFGGKIYYANGFEYHTTRYQESDLGNVLWYAGGIVDWNNAWTTHRGVNEVDHGGYNEAEETEFVTGCLFCFDQVVVEKVGMWDEEYFLYYEDADYSERIKRAGISLLYNPHIAIWHKNAQSSDGSGSKLHEKLQRKSHLRYALKYAPLRTKIHVLKNYFLRR